MKISARHCANVREGTDKENKNGLGFGPNSFSDFISDDGTRLVICLSHYSHFVTDSNLIEGTLRFLGRQRLRVRDFLNTE